MPSHEILCERLACLELSCCSTRSHDPKTSFLEFVHYPERKRSFTAGEREVDLFTLCKIGELRYPVVIDRYALGDLSDTRIPRRAKDLLDSRRS